MKQLFLMVDSGSVALVDTPPPTIKENCLLVETAYSVVSAGTERMLTSFGSKNLLAKALERPDQVKKVVEKMSTDGVLTTIDAAFSRLKEPMPMGYSAVGRVISVGRNVTGYQPDDYVCMVGQAYHSEINRVNKNLVSKLPAPISDLRPYSFCALAGIALEAIHQSNLVPGETVGVVGMGLLGHILSRILHAYGCDVIGYDIVDKSMENTKLKAFIFSNDENSEDKTKALTLGQGVDKVIITASTSSNEPMDLAAAIIRDRGTICMVGVTRMDIDRRPYYQKELTFTIARSYGAGRYISSYEEDGVDLPIGYVRFSEGRNIEEFIRLITSGRLYLDDLISHSIPFDQAEIAYEMITTNIHKTPYIGILLEYPKREDKYSPCIVHNRGVDTKSPDSPLMVGLIGAGSFARNMILPIMKSTNRFHFKALATTGGPGAAQGNSLFHFDYSTNDYRQLIQDPEIDLIVISTTHNSHAKFVVEALQADKNVYCEKPLCLTLVELESIKRAYAESGGELFCGLNRRHAPLIQIIKKEMSNSQNNPAIYDYIANAGFIPPDHWTQEPSQGGGRIIGEACHFIDTIQYLDGSSLSDISVQYTDNRSYARDDNCLISLRFESGATANILYTSMGSKKYPKEQLRVFTSGIVYEMDNYIRLSRYGNIKKTKYKLKQDKGIYAEYNYIADTIARGQSNSHIQDAFRAMDLLLKEVQK